jgi:hypothetical protein
MTDDLPEQLTLTGVEPIDPKPLKELAAAWLVDRDAWSHDSYEFYEQVDEIVRDYLGSQGIPYAEVEDSVHEYLQDLVVDAVVRLMDEAHVTIVFPDGTNATLPGRNTR